MNSVSAKQAVDIVLRARKIKATDEEIRQQLANLGVPVRDTISVIDATTKGFQAGVVAIVTGGLSAKEIRVGENPVFDVAFKRGKAAMRFTTPGWVLLRVVGPWILLALLIGTAIYFAIR